jgi:hypothetical protein
VKALLPHVEKQIQQLSDLVSIIKILRQWRFKIDAITD